MDLISVIVPNYNHAKHLKQRIDSILSQTYQNFELIILDDNSQDNSRAIIEEYRDNSKVSHIHYAENNSGLPFGMWQYGIEVAKGEWIWIAESDDWCKAEFLEKIAAIIKTKQLTVVHTQSLLYYDEKYKSNSWWKSFNSARWDYDFIEDGKRIITDYGRYKCPVINVSSAVFRKDAVKSNYLPIGYRYCGDWYFWVNIFMTGKVGFIAEPLNIIRVHPQSATSASKSGLLDKLKENITVIKYANSLVGKKLVYDKKYEWVIRIWNNVMKSAKSNTKRMSHEINLPYSFHLALYRFMVSELINKLSRKLVSFK